MILDGTLKCKIVLNINVFYPMFILIMHISCTIYNREENMIFIRVRPVFVNGNSK